MKKDMTTDELLARLFKATDLKDILKNGDIPQLPSFCDYILQMCIDRGETREHVIKRAGINRTYGHQLFNGTRMPSRDKVLRLAFGFGLDLEQTQDLLKVARQTQLVPQVKRDAAILYGIMHKMTAAEISKLLESFEMQSL